MELLGGGVHRGRESHGAVQAAHAETEYGWIEPGRALEGVFGDLAFALNRFWERPEARLAELFDRGCPMEQIRMT